MASPSRDGSVRAALDSAPSPRPIASASALASCVLAVAFWPSRFASAALVTKPISTSAAGMFAPVSTTNGACFTPRLVPPGSFARLRWIVAASSLDSRRCSVRIRSPRIGRPRRDCRRGALLLEHVVLGRAPRASPRRRSPRPTGSTSRSRRSPPRARSSRGSTRSSGACARLAIAVRSASGMNTSLSRVEHDRELARAQLGGEPARDGQGQVLLEDAARALRAEVGAAVAGVDHDRVRPGGSSARARAARQRARTLRARRLRSVHRSVTRDPRRARAGAAAATGRPTPPCPAPRACGSPGAARARRARSRDPPSSPRRPAPGAARAAGIDELRDQGVEAVARRAHEPARRAAPSTGTAAASRAARARARRARGSRGRSARCARPARRRGARRSRPRPRRARLPRPARPASSSSLIPVSAVIPDGTGSPTSTRLSKVARTRAPRSTTRPISRIRSRCDDRPVVSRSSTPKVALSSGVPRRSSSSWATLADRRADTQRGSDSPRGTRSHSLNASNPRTVPPVFAP